MIAIGVSPVATRSAAGRSDSTNIGFCAAKSRINFSAFSLPMSLSRLATHCVVVVCWVGSGMTSLPRYCGLTRSSRDLGASAGLIDVFIVDHADDDVAVARTEIRIDRLLGEIFRRRRIVLGEKPFFEHDLHRIIVGQDNVEERFAGAIFAQRAVHDFGRRGAPVVSVDAGFFLKRGESCIRGVGFQRSVDDGFAFFLARCDKTGALAEKRRGAENGSRRIATRKKLHCLSMIFLRILFVDLGRRLRARAIFSDFTYRVKHSA